MRPLLTTTVATAVLLLASAGCTADADPPSSPDTPTSTPEPSEPPEPPPLPEPSEPSDYRIPQDIEGGTKLEPGRWALAANGREDDTVLAELDVPQGWTGVSWFVGSDTVTVGYWLVTEVPTDPCLEEGRHDPGPTVEDLVTALDEQRLTTITGQRPVTIGGHDGTYVEIVAPDIDYAACQEGQIWLWETTYNGARHHEGPPGAIERVWIIDVDGQRVVFNGIVEGDDPGAVAELERVLGSTSFLEP